MNKRINDVCYVKVVYNRKTEFYRVLFSFHYLYDENIFKNQKKCDYVSSDILENMLESDFDMIIKNAEKRLFTNNFVLIY